MNGTMRHADTVHTFVTENRDSIPMDVAHAYDRCRDVMMRGGTPDASDVDTVMAEASMYGDTIPADVREALSALSGQDMLSDDVDDDDDMSAYAFGDAEDFDDEDDEDDVWSDEGNVPVWADPTVTSASSAFDSPTTVEGWLAKMCATLDRIADGRA